MALFYELLLLFFCIATILKMSDRPQRSLRPRKPYPYLPPDVSFNSNLDLRSRSDQIPPPQLQ